MNVARYVIETLARNGVRQWFGYPGLSSLALFRALQESRLPYLMCRTEQGAADAAIGYMKATGKRAACLISYGAGATNIATSLATAHTDFVPLLAIAGGTASELWGSRSFQEADLTGVLAPVTKYAARVDVVRSVPRELSRALTSAYTFRPGPVFLDIPSDVLEREIRNYPARIPIRYPSPSTPSLHRVEKLLEESSRPLIILGSGARECATDVRRFVRRYGIPVVHTLGGTGVVPDASPYSGGLLRQNGSPVAASLAQHADLILALGTNLDRRATALPSRFAPGAVLVRVDLAREELQRNVPAKITLRADAGSVLRRLCVRPLSIHPWQERLSEWKTRAQTIQPGFDPAGVVRSIKKIVPHAIIVSGSGEHKYWALNTFTFSHPRQFIASNRFAAMGFGLPGAIGAAAGVRGPVVLVVGDGDMLMALGELTTVCELRQKNLYIVVINNQSLGSTYNHQLKRWGAAGVFSTVFKKRVDFCELARGIGLEAYRITSTHEFPKLSKRLQKPGPVLFDCHIDPAVRIPAWTDPMNGSLDDLAFS